MPANHIDRLPVEILVKIIGYLAQARKYAMCRTSRRYREVAQSMLYRDLKFKSSMGYKIQLLFSALISRPGLVRNIRSFRLLREDGYHNRVIGPNTDVLGADRHANKANVRALINKNIRNLDNDLMKRLLDSVFSDLPSFDGLVAIILCSASQLNKVKLHLEWTDGLPLSREVMGRECWCINYFDNDGSTKGDYTPRKVKYYGLKGWSEEQMLQVSITSAMEKLRLGPCYTPDIHPGPLTFPYHTSGTATNLRTLLIWTTNFDPAWLVRTIEAGHLSQLEVLRVWELGLSLADGPQNMYDYGQMSDAIATYLPNLKILNWGVTVSDPGLVDPLGSLSRNENLREIQVDLELVTKALSCDSNDSSQFADPAGFLPPALQRLHVLSFSLEYMDQLCTRFAFDNQTRDATIAAILERAETLPSLEILCISLEMDKIDQRTFDNHGTFEMPEHVFDALKYIVKELAKKGFELQIWRQSICHQEMNKVLIKPSFVREWPHWYDVGRSQWCPIDQNRYQTNSDFRKKMDDRFLQWHEVGEPSEGEKIFDTDEKIGNEQMIEGSDEDTDDEHIDGKKTAKDMQDENTEGEEMTAGSYEDTDDEKTEDEEMTDYSGEDTDDEETMEYSGEDPDDEELMEYSGEDADDEEMMEYLGEDTDDDDIDPFDGDASALDADTRHSRS